MFLSPLMPLLRVFGLSLLDFCFLLALEAGSAMLSDRGGARFRLAREWEFLARQKSHARPRWIRGGLLLLIPLLLSDEVAAAAK